MSTMWGFTDGVLLRQSVHGLGFRKVGTVHDFGTYPKMGCPEFGDVCSTLPKPVSIFLGTVYKEIVVTVLLRYVFLFSGQLSQKHQTKCLKNAKSQARKWPIPAKMGSRSCRSGRSGIDFVVRKENQRNQEAMEAYRKAAKRFSSASELSSFTSPACCARPAPLHKRNCSCCCTKNREN